MGVGAGLYMYDVVVQKFTFAISSPVEFLYYTVLKHVLSKKLGFAIDHLFVKLFRTSGPKFTIL